MQFKLISVDFKEAALDSPTFRANVNYLDLQITNIETWLQAIMQFLHRFPNYEKELKGFTYLYLEHLRPTLLQDGFLEQDYTVRILQSVVSDLQSLWEIGIAILSVNRQPVTILENLLINDIPKYRLVRQKFESLQAKYDNYMSTYCSIPKLKEPTMVMNDAHQFFEVRKEYIRMSLEITMELNNLAAKLDKEFIKFSKDIFLLKTRIFDEMRRVLQLFNLNTRQMDRISAWSVLRLKSQAILDSDIEAAKNHVEQQAVAQWKPLSNIDDYKPQLINVKTLNNIEENSIEKHGILFMKTFRSSNHGKPVWIRRWGYIKGGVFGLFLLSPLGNAVQETDKIGLLICNIKYAVNEDRRNCFEIQTVDQSYVFQCELYLELKLWLKVYNNERLRILNSEDQGFINIASQRFPPILKEMADTINTTTDKFLTSLRVISKDGQVVMSLKLSSQIEQNQKNFKKYVYNQMCQIRTPFVTELTKLAVLSYSFISPTFLPTALTANVWGSINWGVYYLNEREIGTHFSESGRARTLSSGLTVAYDLDLDILPNQDSRVVDTVPDVPHHLRARDMQMRALFETAVEQGEICLFSFNCTWIPNLKQELTGKCFVTANHIYAYFNEKGFISMFKSPTKQVTAFEVTLGDSYDIGKIHTVDATIKMKFFLEDSMFVKRKIDFLIANIIKDEPYNNETLVKIFQTIDKEQSSATEANIGRSLSVERANGNAQKLGRSHSSNTVSSGGTTNFQSTPIIDNVIIGDHKATRITPVPEVELGEDSVKNILPDDSSTSEYKIDYGDEKTRLSSATYHIPPKAIFHALLGDHSTILKTLSSVSRYKTIIKKAWNVEADGSLSRKYNGQATYFSRKEYPIQFKQHVDVIRDNEFYSFTHSKGPFQTIVGGPFVVEYRVVIYATLSSTSKVVIFGSPVFEKKEFLAKYIMELFSKVLVQEARVLQFLIKTAEKAIGTHGPVPKSIFLYGKLLQLHYVDETPDVPPAFFGPLAGMWLMFNRLAIILFHCMTLCSQLLFELTLFIIRTLALNKILILGLFILSLLNIFLAGRSSLNYWNVKKASQVAQQFVSSDPYSILRSIYIKDYEDYILEHKFGTIAGSESATNDSKCFQVFRKGLFVLNHGHSIDWSVEYFNEGTKNIAKGLRSTLSDIGIQRNDLLTRLKMLNKMEFEIAEAEWRNWLLSESQRCEMVISEGIDLKEIIDYCQECINHLENTGLI